MKIADYKDAMEFFKNSRQEESNGKWKEFVEESRFDDMLQEPRTMAQGPRIPFGEGGNFETWLKTQPEGTEFRTKSEIFKKGGVKNTGFYNAILDKYKDKFKITTGSRLGGDVATKNKAIKEFFDTQELGSKINVDQSVVKINKNLPKNEQISATGLRNRLNDTKLNTRAIGAQTLGKYHGELSDLAKAHIEETYGDSIKLNFNKNKYGVSAGGRGESKALYESIRRFVEGGAWDRAYNVGSPEGWILESYKRAGYKPIKEIMPKSKMEKFIGFEAPDGTKWFSSKTAAFKHNGKHVTTSHPGWDRVNKLVSIVKETRVAPSQAIADLLAKGGVKNIDGLTLERLTGYLLNNDVDIKNIKKGLTTFHKHHVKGVKVSPDADIQLVTNVANKEANKVNIEIAELKKKNLPIDYDALDKRLKNYGVTIEVDGKRLGGKGFESISDIEKWTTKKIGTWKTADFEKFAKQFIKNDVKFASFPANVGAMWRAIGSGGRKALGWGTAGLTELIFMGLDMKNELSKGKSTEEAASIAKQNASFGIYSDDAYLRGLKKVAEDMDIDTRAFDKVFAFNERMSKISSQLDYENVQIERLKTMGPLGIEEANRLQKEHDERNATLDLENEKLIEEIAGQVSISKAGEVFPNPNLDQIAKSRYTLTSEDFEKVITDLQEAGIEKLKREKTTAFDVQSKQADPEAGSTFNPITNWFTGTENFWDFRTKGQEKQRLINDMLEFSPQELYRYNLARGVDPDNPITQESFQNLIHQQPGLGFAGAEGGIANIRRPNAIPPESGPTPYGLPSMLNRVKKW